MTRPVKIDYQAALLKAENGGGPTAFLKETLVQIKHIIGTSIDDTDKVRWRYARNNAPHFTIETGDRLDVSLPEHVLAKHPDKVTIALQSGFTDLRIFANSFSVTMDFSGTPHPIIIPYTAITHIRDPRQGNIAYEITWSKKPHRPLDAPRKPRHPGLDFLGNAGA